MKQGEDQGEIPGLKNGDAKALADYVNQMIVGSGGAGMTTGNFQNQPVNAQGAQKPQQKASSMTPGAGMFCPKCGAENDLSAKFCTACGAKLGR